MYKLLALTLLAASACCPQMPPCAVPIPGDAVDVTGDGQLVAHPVGKGGGTLRLGPDNAPALLVPDGALPEEGLVLSMRKSEPQAPEAEGSAVSGAFELSPPVEAKPPLVFTFTVAAPQLPQGCSPERLRFAFERPNDVGPGSPTLRWDYERAVHSPPLVAAVLPRLHGHRMQFVCLPQGAP